MLCRPCGRELPKESFAWKNKAKRIRASWCRACQKQYKDEHYRNNRAKYVKRAREYELGYYRRARAFLVGYFATHPCVDCGESDIRVLQFDHVRGAKVSGVGDLIHRQMGWPRVLAEIEKCQVRCSNCHLRRTGSTYGWWSAFLAASSTG